MGPTEEFEQAAAKERRGQMMFHWPLEFPEVIVKRGGFDAFIGNPPYLGGKRIGTELGPIYSEGIRALVIQDKGIADLCAYFERRAFVLLNELGFSGMILTNTIAQGDTRLLGLAAMLSKGATIIFAMPDQRWPGTANVTVSLVCVSKSKWKGHMLLSGVEVESVSSFLTGNESFSTPNKLLVHPCLHQ